LNLFERRSRSIPWRGRTTNLALVNPLVKSPLGIPLRWSAEIRASIAGDTAQIGWQNRAAKLLPISMTNPVAAP
jgi:hypothetical protein